MFETRPATTVARNASCHRAVALAAALLLAPVAVVPLLTLTAPAAHAQDKIDPVEQYNSQAFWFVNWTGLSNATLEVVTPAGEKQRVEAKTGTPVYEISRAKAMDGVYRYELNAATQNKIKIVQPIDNGRGSASRDYLLEPFYKTGRFIVSRGVIVPPDDTVESPEK